MTPQLERLIALQRLETAIASAKQRITAHPDQIHAADARLEASRLTLEDAKQRLKDSQDARRSAEKDAALQQGRLAKYRDQLSAVKTNREYQAMQKEMEVAQEHLGAAEDTVLTRMVESDAFAAEVTKAEKGLAARQKEVDAEKRVLADELGQTERRLNDDSAARDALLAELEPRLLQIFESVARARKGIAISSATRDGLCEACHVRLRPQVFQQVRQNDNIIQCDSCHRILYYVPPPPPVEPAVTHSS